MTDRDPALAGLDVLIGTWDTTATHPAFDGVVPGSTTFEWLEGGHFLVIRSRAEHEQFPDAIWVVGPPEAGEEILAEYFDSRGVRRSYGVSIEGGVLRMWRDAPGFDQRFAATLDVASFVGQWQLAEAPGQWKDDLRVEYRRRG